METLSIDTERFADQGYMVFAGAFDIVVLRDQLAAKIAADVRPALCATPTIRCVPRIH